MTSSLPQRPPLDPARLASLAPTWRLELLDATPSTNAVVAARALAGEPEGLVVTTEHQYAGRGRLDRVWEMPPRAALAVSVLLRPDLEPALWPWLPLATGVAVATALQGDGARVKWPNDVLLGERKVCGILVERVETPSGPAAVVGIGLNASLTAEELPVPAATSLWLERGEEVDRTDLLIDLLDRLGDAYDGVRTDPDILRRAYAEASATIGREVRVELPSGETLEGVAVRIEPDGRLLVATPGGERAVAAGDVVHARLA